MTVLSDSLVRSKLNVSFKENVRYRQQNVSNRVDPWQVLISRLARPMDQVFLQTINVHRERARIHSSRWYLVCCMNGYFFRFKHQSALFTYRKNHPHFQTQLSGEKRYAFAEIKSPCIRRNGNEKKKAKNTKGREKQFWRGNWNHDEKIDNYFSNTVKTVVTVHVEPNFPSPGQQSGKPQT